jgi:hypothetical protein
LQNSLVLYTLALAHFAEWKDVPDPERLSEEEMPYGAFILALQAVSDFPVFSYLFVFRWSFILGSARPKGLDNQRVR